MKDQNSRPYGLDWAVTEALLAQAVVRLIDRQKGLAERTEQSVSTGVLTTPEELHDAQ